MRNLSEMEVAAVSGAGTVSEVKEVVDTGIDANAVEGALVGLYEGLVGAMSYVIGRVAGDLHPSYYQ